MKTTSKATKNIQRPWRISAFAIASALVLAAAGNALAASAPSISSGDATGTVGVTFNYQIQANMSPTSYNATGRPPGLSVNTTSGVISGTPTTAGVYNPVHLTATNASGTGAKDVKFTINPAPTPTPTPPPTVTSSGTASGTWGVAFSYQITANQTITSYATTVSIPGVSFSTSTGLFSGTPTSFGTFSGTISGTNANGTGSKTLTVTINRQPHTAPSSIATISPTAVWEGDPVTLDGTQSHTNPDDGSTLQYQWQQQAPASPVSRSLQITRQLS